MNEPTPPEIAGSSLTIGRLRLPKGIVAIQDAPDALRAGIAVLHRYSVGNRQPDRPRCGIVFRVVDAREQQAIAHKIQKLAGMPAFNKGMFQVTCGLWHIIDDRHVTHICNRHSDEEAEALHGQNPMLLEDFQRIPQVVQPRHIVEFTFTKRMPRIIYRKALDTGVIVVVEEIQRSALAVITAYKTK